MSFRGSRLPPKEGVGSPSSDWMGAHFGTGVAHVLRGSPVDLAEKVSPRHSAVIVVDMQNEFCSPGNAYERAGLARDLNPIREMVPRLAKFLVNARRSAVPVIYVQAIYDREFLSPAWMEQARRRRPRMYSEITVCAAGSWGAQIIEPLTPAAGDTIIQKHRYSAFIGTPLVDLLRRSHVQTILVTGVGTCGCVDSTARDGFMLDFTVVVVEDCVAMAWGGLHAAALAQIDALFGEVRASDEIVAAWDDSSRSRPSLEATAPR